MSFATQSLKYGWKIAAGIALTGGTIFVADNVLHRITAPTVIELVLGTVERCLATQYSTNPVSYRVAPPMFVRTWYSNSYDGTNVTLYSEIVTNTIGWRTDREMLASLDTTIKALVPYYCDTNYNALTVTGLWASLGIGDGTNKFTSTPCFTNNVGQTNCTTNAATYGDLSGRLYEVNLVERYKMLNALKRRRIEHTNCFTVHAEKGGGGYGGYAEVVNQWENHAYWYAIYTNNYLIGAYEEAYTAEPDYYLIHKYRTLYFVTNAPSDYLVWLNGESVLTGVYEKVAVKAQLSQNRPGYDGEVFLTFEAPGGNGEWITLATNTWYGNSDAIIPESYFLPEHPPDDRYAIWYLGNLSAWTIYNYGFSYCANKFW